MRTKMLILIGLFVAAEAYSIKCPGYFVTPENDTVNVSFNLIGNPAEEAPTSLAYVDSEGTQRKLFASQAKAVTYNYDGEEVVMISRYTKLGKIGNKTYSNFYRFLKPVKKGKIDLYVFMHSETSFNTTTMSETTTNRPVLLIYKEGEESPLLYNKSVFKKVIPEYIKECPVVTEKLANKEYKKGDIEELVEEYNSCIQ